MKLKTKSPALSKFDKLKSINDPSLQDLDTIPKKIYVASSMDAASEARRIALELMASGFFVTSRWLRHSFRDRPQLTSQKFWQEYAKYEETWGERDLEDLKEADTLVLLSSVPSSTGGFHVELGYFLGCGGNIVVVGDRPNVFFYTSAIRFLPNADKLTEWLVSQAC